MVSMLYTAIRDNRSLIISLNCIISVFTRIYTHTVAHAHTSTRVRVKRCLRAFPRLSFRDISAPLSKPIFEISIRLASLPLFALVNNCHRRCVRIEMGLEARGIAQLSWLYRSFENRDEGEKLWKIASLLCALLRSSVRVTLRNLHVSM